MDWKTDKATLILCGAVVFFTMVTLLVVYTRPEDTQFYQLFSTTLSGFSGALLLKLTGKDTGSDMHPQPPVTQTKVDEKK